MNSDSVYFVIFEKWYNGEWHIYGIVEDEQVAKNYQSSSIIGYHEFKLQRTLKLD